LKPIYTGDNIDFFEENVFLSKEDILSGSNSIKDFFAHQAINIYDFGKINIMSNGDVYANLNHPPLGNIYTNSIYEIIQKEIDEGKSWLRIRNQTPCNNCVYQWLCPSPSDYEIAIGRQNLCHINN
jgi:pseudo-rSAM protein